MPSFEFYSIGHSNIPQDRFVGMLRSVGVGAIADVRSTPASRHFPWFSAKRLQARLQQEGISYLPSGAVLGGRPHDPSLYRKGVADYEAMARRPEFQAGLDALTDVAAARCLCLMCAEREPLDCHRCLLVARALAERGHAVGHILHDGAVEPHTATEQRLLALGATEADLFVTGQSERLAAAYRCRARTVAYRAPDSMGATPVTELR